MVDGQWSCTRNAADFWAELSKAVSFIAEEQVQLTA
jgi:frataxin-like iron-binding protein CyaY